MPENTLTSPLETRAERNWFLRWWSSARLSLSWMVIIAFFLRVLYILLLHTYRFKPVEHSFSFGWEMGSVGRALAAGRGFRDPFGVETGPTAWEPPLYPFLIGGVFKIFGIFTSASAIVLLFINSIFSALNCIPIFLLGRRCFGDKVAVWSAWTWALLPYIMYWCSRWVWETSLSALLLTTLAWLALSMEDKDGVMPWIEFGFLWGIAALNSPVLLAFLPASGLWAWCRRAARNKPSLGGVALATVIFVACIIPWGLRNQRTLGKFVLLRDNLGAELRLGNGPWADGTWMYFLHPTQNVLAMQRYREMGELNYIAERKKEAVVFITEDPLRFLWISAKRFIYYWGGGPRASEIWWLAQAKNSLFLASSVVALWGLGRAVRKKKPGAWLLVLLFATYPTIYYFIFPHPRYRHPIEPAILLLGVYLFTEVESPRRKEVAKGQPASTRSELC